MESTCLPPPQSSAMTMARHGNPTLGDRFWLWRSTIYLQYTGLNSSQSVE